jgi:lipopolysaccharide export system permease protein
MKLPIEPLKRRTSCSRFPKRIDWYIITKFLGTYFFSLALILAIAVVFDFNEHLDKFVQNEAPWKAIIFDYYLNFVPYFGNLFSPLFVFIAVIFFTSKLAENSEIIAMFSSGISFHRLMVPYFISALIIAILTYLLGAYIIPKGNITRIEFENTYKKKKIVETGHNVQLEVADGIIAYFDRFEKANSTGYRFSLDRFEGNTMKSHFTAKTLTYADDPDNPDLWRAKNWQLRDITDTLEVITSGLQLDTLIHIRPGDLLITEGQQETMTSPELKRYIERQRRRGFANIKAFEIEYDKRIATSFASFILTLIGVSLSSKKVKGGMGMNLGVGIALSFGYIVFQTISSTFAIKGNMPPLLAVWLPNIVFLLIGIYLYWKAPK